MKSNLTYNEIIQRLGYFMNVKQTSAYKLSRMLGHSNSYIYRVQSGEIKLTLETLLDILEIFDLSLNEFFCNDLK